MSILTSRRLAAAMAVAAGACAFGFLGMLPTACGPTGENLPDVLLVAAGCSLAAAVVLVGNRRSAWLWVGALAGGGALSVLLLVMSFASWAENCTR